MGSAAYGLAGFVDVVLALVVWTLTSSRRGTKAAWIWAIIVFLFVPSIVVWAIYMLISSRSRRSVETY